LYDSTAAIVCLSFALNNKKGQTMNQVTVAATQMACSNDRKQNINNAENLVVTASKKGAQIILLQELFETRYFCQEEKQEYFSLATSLENNPAVKHFANIAEKLKVVLPISFFERKNKAFYNTVAVIDADGSVLGTYRKCHIPDGPGYEEKFYFNPGDTGFKVWPTKFADIGVGICWDQWFPEAARIMALKGADLVFYSTAIGSEPVDETNDSKDHWQTCMQGHAACNMVPVIASNRIGTETFGNSHINFMAHHLSRTIRDRSFPRPAGQMNLSSQHHLTLNNTGWKELHGAFSGIDDPPSTVPFSQTTADINKMADNQSSKDNQNIVDHGRPSKASL
jgi:N-carbamoylputrescine amidase